MPRGDHECMCPRSCAERAHQFPSWNGSLASAISSGTRGCGRNALDDERKQEALLLALPLGTQVVTRAPLTAMDGDTAVPIGAVGTIVAVPHSSSPHYVVRFPDGEQAAAARDDLTIRKHAAMRLSSADDEARRATQLMPFVIYRCVIGSRAYGLEHGASDTDRRGIYLPPADLHWSLDGVPEQLEKRGRSGVLLEWQKFICLALKANPNVLECLYSPIVETLKPPADELLAMRHIFVAVGISDDNGYVLSQFKSSTRSENRR